jgi:hypothetical protein
MTFDAFLDDAWSDHAERPQAVADRLMTAMAQPQTADDIVQLGRLAAHVFGEHLGQWQRGIEFLDTLRDLPAGAGSAVVDTSLARAITTLRYASGDATAVETLSPEDRACVLAGAAQALIGRDEPARGTAAFEAALALGERGLPAGSPALRALAAAGNNIAVTLEQKAQRAPADTRTMVTAAQAGLRYWKQAGTWLEEERAQYRLARTLLAAGRADEAIAAAQACLHVCTCNAAPAFERFFGHAALAVARRAVGDRAAFEAARADALAAFEQVPDDLKAWCDRERAELGT